MSLDLASSRALLRANVGKSSASHEIVQRKDVYNMVGGMPRKEIVVKGATEGYTVDVGGAMEGYGNRGAMEGYRCRGAMEGYGRRGATEG